LLPEPKNALSIETMQYSNMLEYRVENDTFHLSGRFGVDFPIVGYRFGDGGNSGNGVDVDGAREGDGRQNIIFGINAAAQLNMRPTSDMRFPVDNFYAVLALYFSGTVSKELSWRFYPVYHLSAHLADGYPGDILKPDVRAVSSEMVRGEGYYKPFGEVLEIGAGAGWYYHVCAQKELKYRGDAAVLLTSPHAFYGALIPYALLHVEDVYQGGNHFGVEAEAGVIARRGKRGFGLGVLYFNRPHSSYYFNEREWGVGIVYTFM
jgi:hypothetical protein